MSSSFVLNPTSQSQSFQKCCSYRYILPDTHIIRRSPSNQYQMKLINFNVSPLRIEKLRQACSYRFINKTFQNNVSTHFNEYSLNFPNFSNAPIKSSSSHYQLQEDLLEASRSNNSIDNNANTLCDSLTTHSLLALPKKKLISKTQQKKQQMLEEPEGQELLGEYKSVKDQNSLKNIKEAFTRHLNCGLSEELKAEYVNLMGGKLTFSQIKKKINFSIKENSTNNKCIKFMCKSNQVSPIFLHFLNNIESFWLDKSKVSNKESCKSIANFLIKLAQNTQFVNLIEHYHTKV